MQEFMLNKTVVGPYSKKTFGRSGDVVTIVAEHDNMLIVLIDGNCWPVLKEEVSEGKAVQECDAIKAAEPVQHPSSRKTKKSKSVITKQTLF